ncbi:RNA 3'-terminal phosphate cyclase [Candidatus Parabeggiatoa sp. HSG14]|uniref:RNA 3'-terminal phosphate cyclase n=1 Tax=Candidatus Parabeggiatoa sp. HSG14 TaxID=3055593 RepID=UPI0025A80CC7|nr:RNA 3'-terminal phosphate cyclase [Thiotrichales bacterium HSG14]
MKTYALNLQVHNQNNLMQTISKQTIEIDGAMGEGGGQVLRTALSLSICTGKPFHINNIRANRKKPGLQRQHLTAVHAARDISGAYIEGDEMGSIALRFNPNKVQSGNYYFAIGTAGSTTLVLQTVLYPLLLADGDSHLILNGGTHNLLAPPFDFLDKVFLPILKRMGAQVTITLERYGFYPRGGGQLKVHITPTPHLNSLHLRERGQILTCRAKALVTGIPEQVAQRELQRVSKKLKWKKECLELCPLPSDQGPGNVLLLEIQSEHITEIFTGFAQRGVRAEAVADGAIKMAKDYLAAEAPVSEYLADQLLIPLALAGKGEFTTLTPSHHTLTNIEVIQHFLPISIAQTQLKENVWVIKVKN